MTDVPKMVPFAALQLLEFFPLNLCIIFYTKENKNLGGFGADVQFFLKVFKQCLHD